MRVDLIILNESKSDFILLLEKTKVHDPVYISI